ncbi:MAG: DUF1353 domain-containing protein, partial [Verrucomicrobiaceae bacterium]
MNKTNILSSFLGVWFLSSCAVPSDRTSPLEAQVGVQGRDSLSRTSYSFGRYSGPIQSEWMPDGKLMRILNTTSYIDPRGVVWTAPKDSKVDGASIPPVFYQIIGPRLQGKYRDASVYHDVACQQKSARWDDAAEMFYNAMRCSGVKESKAKVMYLAVYKFGPTWPAPKTADRTFLSQLTDW